MISSSVYITIIVGVILSLIFTEMTGVIPAGLVIPGYLAFSVEHPQTILLMFLISILTYFIVVFGIAKITILYGKRKFVAMVTVGILLNYIVETFLIRGSFGVTELVVIGLVIPGLMANTIQRQGLVPTITSTTLLTFLTFGISSLIMYVS